MGASVRSYRADLALRALDRLQTATIYPYTARGTSGKRIPLSFARQSLRCKSTSSPPTAYEPRITRWNRYEDPTEVVREKRQRNPLNYFERERQRVRHNQYLKKRMLIAGLGIAGCFVAQCVLVFGFAPEKKSSNVAATGAVERLDARPPKEGEAGFSEGGKGGVQIVGQKPGVPGVALDEQGRELVETGNSTIPYFSKTIRLPVGTSRHEIPTSSALPASASAQAHQKDEEYTLLGHGVRTVSFLGIQVYYMGIYVRTIDLAELQRRFVVQAAGNESATSLIPPEKMKLRQNLLDDQASREAWDAVLRGKGIKSAIRVIPIKNTDFAHLRDGWVRGITNQTQDAARRAVQEKRAGEYDDERFGKSVSDFKDLFRGRGKAPTGSVMILAQDDGGSLFLSYQNAPTKDQKARGELVVREDLGTIDDDRISHLIWLGYLGGKNVSSEPARKSVVDGIIELVERPMGTVGIDIV